MSTTIKDIARVANVSTATVSRVINKKDEGVSDSTRKKVLDIIEELDYQPNAFARGLVTKKSKTIGLIIPDITNPFFPDVTRGVEDVANKNGYNVFLCNTDDDSNKQNQYINTLKEKHVDGIIFTFTSIPKYEHVLKLIKSGVPVVMLDRQIDFEDIYGVFLDNHKGGYLATKHLIDLGHKKIGCIAGPLHSKNSRERLEGYKKALSDAEIDFNEKLVIAGDFKLTGGMKATKKLLTEEDLTALFICNDLMVYGAYKEIKSMGYKIPKDISIVGFDDIQLSQVLEPQLTTIRQPIYDMGAEASKMLIKLIKGKKIRKKVVGFNSTLIIRESTRSI